MSDYGIKWGSYAFLQYDPGGGSANIDAINVADEADLTSDPISLDETVAVEIGLTITENEDNGAPDGLVKVYLLREGATDYQSAPEPPDFVMQLPFDTLAQTQQAAFHIPSDWMGTAKVFIDNDCGKQVAVSAKIRTATWGETT